MQVLHRIALPFINASFITAALFALMYSLVHIDEPELLSVIPTPIIAFADVPEDTEPETLVIRPPEPTPIEPTPDLPKIVKLDHDGPTIPKEWGGYQPPVLDGKGLVPTDNQLTLVLGYPPVYPNGALQRNIEGFAVVGFSVSQAGEVFDAYILESEPKGVFDRSALKAISKFKYRARVENGKPAATDGQRYMFSYEID